MGLAEPEHRKDEKINDINDDYLCPDIMIVCDRKSLKGSSYSGVPKFIAETLSPSTAKKDSCYC